MIGEAIREDVVEKIRKSHAFGLLTDEVTDISNTAQLITFAKYYNVEIGDAETRFVGLSDLLADSEDTSANSQSIFNSLVTLVGKLQLPLHVPLHKNLEACKTLLSIHCICHRLALACSDTGDELSFVKDF